MTEEQELKQIFDSLSAEHDIENMVKFSDLDIHEKLQNNEMLKVKYNDLYQAELRKYEILERKMDALKGLRYKYYRFDDEKEYVKKEIEDYCLPSDEKIIKMKKIMSKQMVKVKFFEMCWKAFTSLQWNMKTFTEREKLGL